MTGVLKNRGNFDIDTHMQKHHVKSEVMLLQVKKLEKLDET